MIGDFPPNQTKTVVPPPAPPPYFLGLPKDPWFLIYEHYLTDPDGENKGNFSLVCKIFDSISKDGDFIKYLCRKYFPVLMDSPDYVNNPKKLLPILQRCFAPLPPIDNTEKFIPRFLSIHFALGYSFEAITSRFIPHLKRMYRRLKDKDLLLAKLNQVLTEVDIKEKSFYLSHTMCQRDPARLQNALELRFDIAVDTAIVSNNFRMLAFLLDADNFNSPEGMNGIRFAATFADISRLKQLLAQKETTLDFSKNPTLAEIKSILESENESEDEDEFDNNLAEIQSRLNIKRFDARVENDLNSDTFLSRISHWHFDDIFRTMTAETLKRLQRLGGQGALSAALIRPLCRAGRADLISLLTISEVSLDGQVAESFIESFEKHRLEGVKSPHLVAGPCQAMLATGNIRVVLCSSRHFLSWAFAQKIEDLILLGLRAVNVGDSSVIGTIHHLIIWSLDNHKQEILDIIFDRFKLNTTVLKALLDEAMVRNLANLVLEVLKSLEHIVIGKEWMKHIVDSMSYVETYVTVLRWAIQLNHLEIINFMLEDNFTENQLFRTLIAQVLFDAIQKGNKALEPLFFQFLKNKGYICSKEMLLWVVENATQDYLEKFRRPLLVGGYDTQLIDFLLALEQRGNSPLCFTTGALALSHDEWARSSLEFLVAFVKTHKARAGIRESRSLSFTQLSRLLNLDYLNDAFHDKAIIDPFAKIYPLLNKYEDFLTIALKIRLLQTAHDYHATAFQSYLLNKYPHDLNYEILCQHLGVNHPLALAHRPSLASRTLQFVSSYMPSFSTNLRKREIEQTKEAASKEGLKEEKDEKEDSQDRKKRNKTEHTGML